MLTSRPLLLLSFEQTVTRAGVLYGPRVIGLKQAVEKADFAAIQKEESAFRLFNSGTRELLTCSQP